MNSVACRRLELKPTEVRQHTASHTDGVGVPQQCFKEKSSAKTEQCNNKYGERNFAYQLN
jgi:hypothetical protein